MEEDIIDAVPLMQRYPSEPLFPPHDLFQEFKDMFDEENARLWDGLNSEMDTTKQKRDENRRKENMLRDRSHSSREEKNLTFEEVSRYFYMPINQAAKELNVGLTLLKKKCRELGIPRWPSRKMKSLQALIKNMQEMGKGEGEAGKLLGQSVIEVLEQEKKLMEKKPATQLMEKTKRLRQACFKANYKKRRLMAAVEDDPSPSSSHGCIYEGEGIH